MIPKASQGYETDDALLLPGWREMFVGSADGAQFAVNTQVRHRRLHIGIPRSHQRNPVSSTIVRSAVQVTPVGSDRADDN